MIGFSDFFLQGWDKGGFLPIQPLTLDGLKALIRYGITKAKPGYREGVLLAPLPWGMFRSKILTLEPGQEAQVFFKSRVPGEEPRLTLPSIKVQSPQDLQRGCTWAVLYAEHVLAEKDEPRTGSEWDLITLLTNPTWEEVPMNPQTLCANHFGISGSTDTLMTSQEFEDALRVSVLWWKDKAMAYVEEPNV